MRSLPVIRRALSRAQAAALLLLLLLQPRGNCNRLALGIPQAGLRMAPVTAAQGLRLLEHLDSYLPSRVPIAIVIRLRNNNHNINLKAV